MFITALFTTAETWNQPRCLSTVDWIKRRWYIHTMEYYAAIKKRAKSCPLQQLRYRDTAGGQYPKQMNARKENQIPRVLSYQWELNIEYS